MTVMAGSVKLAGNSINSSKRQVNIPPSWHWSISESRRSCSRWSVVHWHTRGCREMGKSGLHPFQGRCGAPEC